MQQQTAAAAAATTTTTTTSPAPCATISIGFWFDNASSSSCVCWSESAFVALRRRTSQTCASRCQQCLIARVYYGRVHAVTSESRVFD